MRQIVYAVEGVADESEVNFSDGQYDTSLSWRSYIPTTVYTVFASRDHWIANCQLRKRIRALFLNRAYKSIFPHVDSSHASSDSNSLPVTARDIKQLFLANAVVTEKDMKELFLKMKEAGVEFSSEDYYQLKDDEYRNIRKSVCPLSRKEVFIFGEETFGPHAEGFGSTHSGRKRLVSAWKEIETRNYNARSQENMDAYFHTLLLRGIGRDTPIGTVYDTPYGMYSIKKRLLDTGCKVVFLSPMDGNSERPPVVVFLPTQITVYSFRQNTESCIGVDAVCDVEEDFVKTCEELGINESRRARFCGYSLGGAQAWLMSVLHIKWVDSIFIINNPGIPEPWQKQIMTNIPHMVDEDHEIQSRIIQTKNDSIAHFGGRQIWAFNNDCQREDGSFPMRHVYSLLSETTKWGNEPKRLSFSRGNFFDLLIDIIRSFYYQHCHAVFLNGSYDMRTFDSKNDPVELEHQSDRLKLGYEMVRRIVVHYLNILRKTLRDSVDTYAEPGARQYQKLLKRYYPKLSWDSICPPKAQRDLNLYSPTQEVR